MAPSFGSRTRNQAPDGGGSPEPAGMASGLASGGSASSRSWFELPESPLASKENYFPAQWSPPSGERAGSLGSPAARGISPTKQLFPAYQYNFGMGSPPRSPAKPSSSQPRFPAVQALPRDGEVAAWGRGPSEPEPARPAKKQRRALGETNGQGDARDPEEMEQAAKAVKRSAAAQVLQRVLIRMILRAYPPALFSSRKDIATACPETVEHKTSR